MKQMDEKIRQQKEADKEKERQANENFRQKIEIAKEKE